MLAGQWRSYLEGKDASKHTITGNVMVLEGVYSPQLKNERDVLVYLPPTYATLDRRYPVIYMHDGQNLFDAATSYVGEWRVDETLEALCGEGIEAIVVGIPHGGPDRIHELSPFADDASEGRGDAYLAFMVETIKPLIDGEFRTAQNREQTGIMGSSMGGLISLYGFFRYSQVFGFAGVVSPALWFGSDAIYDVVGDSAPPVGRLYMDVGTDEHRVITHDPKKSLAYLKSVQRMNSLLIGKGYQPDVNYLYIEDQGATHNEAEWARRLPDALRFLLR